MYTRPMFNGSRMFIYSNFRNDMVYNLCEIYTKFQLLKSAAYKFDSHTRKLPELRDFLDDGHVLSRKSLLALLLSEFFIFITEKPCD